MKDFFISYTNADRQWAEWIAWQLESVSGNNSCLATVGFSMV